MNTPDFSPMSALTPTQRRVLSVAAQRQSGCICPMWPAAAAQMAVINSLRRKGYATDESTPRITDAGRAALEKETQ